MTEKRTYNLGRRAETAAETRQRLVEATAALHAERGITATSLRDIAERAGVSVGTAYHHFPTYLDAVRACGAHTMANAPLPPESTFDGLEELDKRVLALTKELCAWYARNPWLERLRGERFLYEPVEEGMTAIERGIGAWPASPPAARPTKRAPLPRWPTSPSTPVCAGPACPPIVFPPASPRRSSPGCGPVQPKAPDAPRAPTAEGAPDEHRPPERHHHPRDRRRHLPHQRPRAGGRLLVQPVPHRR